SLALEKATHLSREARSIGLSFQRRVGSLARVWRLLSCSSSLTDSQYFSRIMPERARMRSKAGQALKKSQSSSSVQKPITRSTPARLYQLRPQITISPAAG